MEELEAIQRRLARVRNEIAATAARLQQLREEEHGLALSVARLSDSAEGVVDDGRLPDPSGSGEKMRITPVVRALLASGDRPLTRHEITSKLSEVGLSVSPDAVSASLSYLRRRGAIRNAGGRWYSASSDQ